MGLQWGCVLRIKLQCICSLLRAYICILNVWKIKLNRGMHQKITECLRCAASPIPQFRQGHLLNGFLVLLISSVKIAIAECVEGAWAGVSLSCFAEPSQVLPSLLLWWDSCPVITAADTQRGRGFSTCLVLHQVTAWQGFDFSCCFFHGEIWHILSVFCLVYPGPIILKVFSTGLSTCREKYSNFWGLS